MKIYTKSGDSGETSLWGGSRVKKSHPRVATYGTLDEANSVIGLALSFLPETETTIHSRLIHVQNEIFVVGSELASQPGAKLSIILMDESEIERLEKEIDEMEAVLSPLQNFILPSGSSAGSALHLARTIVRRAERECVELIDTGDQLRPEVVRYLNRLSDYLFVMARYVNHVLKKTETKWIPLKQK